jgi:hypothetical protein
MPSTLPVPVLPGSASCEPCSIGIPSNPIWDAPDPVVDDCPVEVWGLALEVVGELDFEELEPQPASSSTQATVAIM